LLCDRGTGERKQRNRETHCKIDTTAHAFHPISTPIFVG
jgi:hypothetical protein